MKKLVLISQVILVLFHFKSFSSSEFASKDLVSVYASGNENERVMIRIYESFGNAIQSSEIVVTQNGETQRIELSAAKPKNRPENDKIILQTLKKYLDNGFRIENSASSGAPETYTVTTYILVK